MRAIHHMEEVMVSLENFRRQNILCDTILITDDRELGAHSVILASASRALCSTFKEIFALKADGRFSIKLSGCNSGDAEIVLRYLYTGTLVMSEAYQCSEEFQKIVNVFKSLGIDCLKLDGADVRFINNSDSTTVVSTSAQMSESSNNELLGTQSSLEDTEHRAQPSCGVPSCNIPDDLSSEINDENRRNKSLKPTPLKRRRTIKRKKDTETMNKINEVKLDEMKTAETVKKNPDGNNPLNEQIEAWTPYLCGYCEKKFSRKSCLQKHVLTHLAESQPSYVCDKCDKVFSSESTLRAHQKVHSEAFPHVCETCGKSYKCKRYLQVHAFKHTDSKPFLCDTCGRGFLVKINLKRHVLKWHTTIRPYICKICGKGFVARPRLVKHEESHTGDRHHMCVTCGAAFTNAGNLMRHQLVHTGEKPYVCPYCYRAFNQKVTLQSHMAVHSEEKKTFRCDECGKHLSKLSNLKKHMQIHPQSKPHVCPICNKQFAIKDYLTRHKATHREKTYLCGICGKGHHTQRSLQSHAKLHENLPCRVCGDVFVGNRALQSHMRIHSAADTYVCETCGKDFNLISQLQAHSKSHHKLNHFAL